MNLREIFEDRLKYYEMLSKITKHSVRRKKIMQEINSLKKVLNL